MKAVGKALSSSAFERPTGVSGRRQTTSAPAPARTRGDTPSQRRSVFQERGRFVSPAGPDILPTRRGPRPLPKFAEIGDSESAPVEDDVRFLTSTRSLAEAKKQKLRLDAPDSGLRIVIYRRTNRGRQFRLWQVDPKAGAPRPAPGAAISFDIFRIPEALMGLTKAIRRRRAEVVAQIIRNYGQQPPPTNVDPR
jgi:hypothetical protein